MGLPLTNSKLARRLGQPADQCVATAPLPSFARADPSLAKWSRENNSQHNVCFLWSRRRPLMHYRLCESALKRGSRGSRRSRLRLIELLDGLKGVDAVDVALDKNKVDGAVSR